MARITLKEALNLVAPRVGMDPVTNRDQLLYILDRAQEAAYNKGTWWGMYKEMTITTRERDVYLPYPYTNLIAVNLKGRPQLKRGIHYQFHQNGYGSIEDCYSRDRRCMWDENVIDAGEVAVPWQPNGSPIHIRCRTKEKEGSEIKVTGTNEDGPVYTYFYDEEEANAAGVIGKKLGSCLLCSTEDQSDKLQYTKTVYGEVVPLEGNDVIIETANRFHTVDSITKSPSLGPVDLYANLGSHGELMVTLAPEQTESVFRRYILPDSCENLKCVHVLAKLGEPAPLSHDGQPLMIQSRMALMYLSLSMHYEFNKMDPNLAEIYLAKGILALDEQNTENTGHTVNPIQVHTPETDVQSLYGFR